jgi:hypothetical protein
VSIVSGSPGKMALRWGSVAVMISEGVERESKSRTVWVVGVS